MIITYPERVRGGPYRQTSESVNPRRLSGGTTEASVMTVASRRVVCERWVCPPRFG